MRDRKPGVFRLGDGLVVRFEQPWSDFTPARAHRQRLLSQNGPTLDRLYLVGGLRPGQGLTRRPTGAAIYKAGATDDELVAFVAASIAAVGFKAPTISEVRPAPFGDVRGVRCNIETATGDGLAFSGTALLAQHGDQLSLILYLAARAHYFAAGLAEVEAIMASAALK